MEEEEAERTEVKKWTKNPDYDQHFELKVKGKSVQLIVAFFDYDAVGDGDDEMGTAQMEFELVLKFLKAIVSYMFPTFVRFSVLSFVHDEWIIEKPHLFE